MSKKLRPGQVKLERALSKLGLASRTQARGWIIEGRVKVNGRTCLDPESPVNPDKASIEIDGMAAKRAESRVFVLHKPRGVVTTKSDEKGRPTVFSLTKVKELAIHLNAVGRLDWATSGLLILTNDNRLADWLTDPANEVPRTYLVSVRGEVTEEEIARLCRGVESEGQMLQADDVVLRKASRKESHLTIRLTEGKNREIRRLFASIQHEVTKLKRVAFGRLELGQLAPGDCRELTAKEIRALFPGAPAS